MHWRLSLICPAIAIGALKKKKKNLLNGTQDTPERTYDSLLMYACTRSPVAMRLCSSPFGFLAHATQHHDTPWLRFLSRPCHPFHQYRVQQQQHKFLVTAAIGDVSYEPRLPLCERPATCLVQLTSLLAWRDRAALTAASAGSSWAEEDDGPSPEDLRTELSWLLDDAVAAISRGGEGTAAEWHQESWRDIERGLRSEPHGAFNTWAVRLREPLDELGEFRGPSYRPAILRLPCCDPPFNHAVLQMVLGGVCVSPCRVSVGNTVVF